jgi:FKBP-type peptidyl-prolyl cis-trans isomerase SlyD
MLIGACSLGHAERSLFMQIEKHRVVSIDYTLTDDEGAVLDSSEGREPLMYVHGVGAIIPGLEQALEGRQSGDEFKVSVPPAAGYGERDDRLMAEVSRENFNEIEDLSVGMRFRVPTDRGDYQVVTVAEIADERVTIDANHPLAGVSLNFDVVVREVRDATQEEAISGQVQ